MIADLVPLTEQSHTVLSRVRTLSSRVGLGSDDLPPAIQEIANKESEQSQKSHIAVLCGGRDSDTLFLFNTGDLKL